MAQKIVSFLLTLLIAAASVGCNKAADMVKPTEPSTSDTTPVLETIQAETAEQESSEASATASVVERVDISFDFTRQPTSASNQLAAWIEDADGQMVKTLLVTNFTAARRGYRNRDMSLSAWVNAANPEGMTDTEIDAISEATPSTGTLTLSWDMTDMDGSRVPDGIYTVKVEGTLYWGSNVLYTAQINTIDAVNRELPVTMLRSEPGNAQNEAMLQKLRISVIVGE
jgi:hypothetical protein